MSISLDQNPLTDTTAGLALGYVTQVCGPPSTGKTQLALQIVALANQTQCWYLTDTCVVQPLVLRLRDLVVVADQPATRLAGTTFWPFQDDYELFQRIAHWKDTEWTKGGRHLLVVDSLDNLETEDIPALRMTLKHLARTMGNVAILLLGGDRHEWASDVAVTLQECGGNRVRASLERHPVQCPGASVDLVISRRGLQSV